MKRRLRRLLDEGIIALIGIRFFDRMAGYIAYQRRRKTRRVLERRLTERGLYPDEVIRGPFCGMKLPDKSNYVECRFEKVVGAYEHELFETITGLPAITPGFDDVFVIGAADGYYAVGLALLLPEARIWAFERDAFRSGMLETIASVNGVRDRIRLRGDCNPDSLNEVLSDGRSLIVCDVDGYETVLLDLPAVPLLRFATLVVETHDCFVPGVSDELKQRFSGSHSICEIHMAGPDFGEFPELAGLKMHEVESLVGSDRPSLQTWLVMVPKTS